MSPTKLQKLSLLIAEFVQNAKPNILECASLMLEDEMFYNVRIKWVDSIKFQSTVIQLDKPRWFIEFNYNHEIIQLEIVFNEFSDDPILPTSYGVNQD